MSQYIFNLGEQINQQQILDEIYNQLDLRLWNNYTDDPTSDGSSYVSESGLVLIFKSTLNETQENKLNNIISNYNYDSNYDDRKKFKINNSYEDPTNLDYNLFGLHKNRSIIFGELRVVDYYRNYENGEYSDLVVKELRDYTRDNGLVQYRIQTSIWYLNDESTGATKQTIKYYTLPESIQEGIDRRENVLAQAKAYCYTTIGEIYSFDLLTTLKSEIDFFSQGYTQPLLSEISGSTKPYLNTQIKEEIISKLRFS